MKILRTLFSLFDRNEKQNLILLFFFMFNNALVQVFGIAIIAPLIAAITMPDSLESSGYITYITAFFQFQTHQDFSIAAGLLILAIMLFGNSFILATNYLSLRYANNRERSIGCRLLKMYLQQPFVFFLNRHSAELLRNVHNEVAYIASNVVVKILNLMTFSITAICIIVFILIINPVVTLILMSILGGAYAFIYLFIKKPLYLLGRQSVDLTESKLRSITDSIRMIKEIKMQNLEGMFLDRFSKAARQYARVRTFSDTAGMAPKYLIEIFAVAAFVCAIIFMVSKGENLEEILPILGIYAFAGFRLMPALQNIFLAVSKIQFSLHSLNLIASEIKKYEKSIQEEQTQPTMSFSSEIIMEHIGFTYDDKNAVLNDINMAFPYKSKTAIAGKSGQGKSTIIDIIAGLISPKEGKLIVDGQPIVPDKTAAWRANVAYISQSTYLLDDSIDMNITLEPNNNKRDEERLSNSKKAAMIDFDDGRDVGENGQRLSGGQKQRIGIARALYQSKPVLIFDEATSSIDNDTERQILKHIENLETTLIFITHKVDTMAFCERVYLVSGGEIIDSGTFNALRKKSNVFRNLLKNEDEYRPAAENTP